ncbi:MAG: DUF721 domain-containing protein [Proteobacteria bacterium]|nr:DUF721 domain-containing protein [Pseudomonadota bacterium]
MARRLPSPEEAMRILREKRTRPQRRPPPPMGRSLRPLIKQLDERFGSGPGALQARWREIAGDRLAAFTEPVKLSKPRGGAAAALELRVQGPAAALVQHQAPEILARVNLFLGPGSVDRLRIVQGPVKAAPAGPTPAQAAKARRRTAPLDAGVEARLAAEVSEAPPKLREALLRLGRAVERKTD